jgi:hypothetical protein
MLANFHIHSASVTFSKKNLTKMRYMMKEKRFFLISMIKIFLKIKMNIFLIKFLPKD